MALLFSNTVDEVVVWLTETTCERWTMRRLLDVARVFHLNLFVIPPFGARFGWYKWDPENAPSPSFPLVRQMGEPRPSITLPPVCIGDLMEYGQTRMSIVVWPDSEYGMPGHYVIFEPLDSELTVTLDMVRIGVNTAHALAAHRTRDTSTTAPAEEPATEAEPRAPAADPANGLAASVREPSHPDWRVKVRQIADEVALAKWNRGERHISVRSVSASVKAELDKHENKNYWGTQGPRSESNIRNEALKGWTFTPPSDAPTDVA
jgi:hypothetical protein